MSTQRSTWTPSWSASDPDSKPPATPAATPNRPMVQRPPAAPARPAAPALPQASGTLTRGLAPGGSSGGGIAPPPAHMTNAAVLADLARQSRVARAELQAAQETFSRRCLALLETMRVVDDSLVQLATHVLGNTVIAAAWFSSRNHHLSQRAPYEVLMVGDREAVVAELLRLEHGVY
ncbi:MAG: MbcA/ParS/Xre antitoxin family protein [Tahibacter sp.]